jgi:hypothetical protein
VSQFKFRTVENTSGTAGENLPAKRMPTVPGSMKLAA